MGKNRNKEISAALYKRIAPLLPLVEPSPKGGRPRLSDEQALNGILFVLRTGTPWEHLPQELGFGSGMTCWRRLRDWQSAGVWHRLHMALLTELRSAGKLDFSRACIDGASVPSPRGARTQGPTRRTGANSAANAI
jgi:transposase